MQEQNNIATKEYIIKEKLESITNSSKKINLANLGIQDSDLEFIKKFPICAQNVECIDLSGNFLTDQCEEALIELLRQKNCPRLIKVNLERNHQTMDNCIKQIQNRISARSRIEDLMKKCYDEEYSRNHSELFSFYLEDEKVDVNGTQINEEGNEESMLYAAIKKKCWKFAAILISEDAKLTEEEKNKDGVKGGVFRLLSDNEQRDLRNELLRYFVRDENASIDYLNSRKRFFGKQRPQSFSVQDLLNPLFVDPSIEKITKKYITPILEVVEHSPIILDLIFDFNNSHVEMINPTQRERTSGVTVFTSGKVYVGAKRSQDEIRGTLVHELCHFALEIVYENKCNPYEPFDEKEEEKKPKKYWEIKKDLHLKTVCKPLDPIIERVFRYPPEEHDSELIVRIPHLIAEKRSEGLELLKKQASDLLGFYEKTILPKMQAFIERKKEYLLIDVISRMPNMSETGLIHVLKQRIETQHVEQQTVHKQTVNEQRTNRLIVDEMTTTDIYSVSPDDFIKSIKAYYREQFTRLPRPGQALTGEKDYDYTALGESIINVVKVEQLKKEEQQEEGEGRKEEQQGKKELEQKAHSSLKPKELIDLTKLLPAQLNKQTTPVTERHLLVEGRAGIGKTTLSRYLAHQWACQDQEGKFKNDHWSQVDLVVLLHLPRLLDEPDEISLAKFICNNYTLGLGQNKFTEGLIKHHLNQLEKQENKKILYVLDGYDQIDHLIKNTRNPRTQKRRHLLKELWEKPFWIITSRPYFADETTLGQYGYLENIGFRDEDKKRYIDSYFQNYFQDLEQVQRQRWTSNFIDKLDTNPSLKEISMIPMYLGWLCAMEASEELSDRTYTLTKIYNKLIQFRAKRYTENNPKLDEEIGIGRQAHSKYFQPSFNILEILAWSLMTNDHSEAVPNDNLNHVMFKHAEIALQGLGFLQPSGDQQRLKSKSMGEKSYSFTHTTLQEYFAARHWVKLLVNTETEKQALNYFREYWYDPRFEVLWRFAAGLIAEVGQELLISFFDTFLAFPKDPIGLVERLFIIRCWGESYDQVKNSVALEARLFKNINEWIQSYRIEIGFEYFTQTLSQYPRLASETLRPAILKMLDFPNAKSMMLGHYLISQLPSVLIHPDTVKILGKHLYRDLDCEFGSINLTNRIKRGRFVALLTTNALDAAIVCSKNNNSGLGFNTQDVINHFLKYCKDQGKRYMYQMSSRVEAILGRRLFCDSARSEKQRLEAFSALLSYLEDNKNDKDCRVHSLEVIEQVLTDGSACSDDLQSKILGALLTHLGNEKEHEVLRVSSLRVLEGALAANLVGSDKQKSNILSGLLSCLNHTRLKSMAAAALGKVLAADSWCTKEQRSKILTYLLLSCLNSDDYDVKCKAAIALGCGLAVGSSCTERQRLKILTGLLSYLKNDGHYGVRNFVVTALEGGLAAGSSCTERQRSGIITGLLRCLNNDNNDGVKRSAAIALGGGLAADSLCTKEQRSEILDGLLYCLTNSGDDHIKYRAVVSLENCLAADSLCTKEQRSKILDVFLFCLKNAEHTDNVESEVVSALGEVLTVGSPSAEWGEQHRSEILGGLLNCLNLNNAKNFHVKYWATVGLRKCLAANMSWTEEQRSKILDGLLFCLKNAEHVDGDVKSEVARMLGDALAEGSLFNENQRLNLMDHLFICLNDHESVGKKCMVVKVLGYSLSKGLSYTGARLTIIFDWLLDCLKDNAFLVDYTVIKYDDAKALGGGSGLFAGWSRTDEERSESFIHDLRITYEVLEEDNKVSYKCDAAKALECVLSAGSPYSEEQRSKIVDGLVGCLNDNKLKDNITVKLEAVSVLVRGLSAGSPCTDGEQSKILNPLLSCLKDDKNYRVGNISIRNTVRVHIAKLIIKADSTYCINQQPFILGSLFFFLDNPKESQNIKHDIIKDLVNDLLKEKDCNSVFFEDNKLKIVEYLFKSLKNCQNDLVGDHDNLIRDFVSYCSDLSHKPHLLYPKKPLQIVPEDELVFVSSDEENADDILIHSVKEAFYESEYSSRINAGKTLDTLTKLHQKIAQKKLLSNEDKAQLKQQRQRYLRKPKQHTHKMGM